MIITYYENNGRKLKQIITGLLKSWLATTIRRINYLQTYTLQDNHIKKEQQKALIIEYIPEKEEKLKNFLQKSGITRYNEIKNTWE